MAPEDDDGKAPSSASNKGDENQDEQFMILDTCSESINKAFNKN